MSFLTICPHVTVGGVFTRNIITGGGNYNKGVVITQQVYDDISSGILKLYVTDPPKVTRKLKRTSHDMYNYSAGKAGYSIKDGPDIGYSFKVKCLLRKTDKLKSGKSSFYLLDSYYTNFIPLSVVIDTEVVPNGVYIITELSDFTLIRKDYYEVEVTFTTWREYKPVLTNKCTVLQSYLKQCKKPGNKVYTTTQIDNAKNGKSTKIKVTSKNKKGKTVTTTKTVKPVGSTCIGYVNQVLYSKGYYVPVKPKKPKKNAKKATVTKYKKDLALAKNPKKYYNTYKNYWTKTSVNALKRFQKKWNKQGLNPKINEKGTISKNCWNALLRYPEVK